MYEKKVIVSVIALLSLTSILYAQETPRDTSETIVQSGSTANDARVESAAREKASTKPASETTAGQLSASVSKKENTEERPAYLEWPNALGAFGSTLAGYEGGGLHFQRWFDRVGVALTFGGYYNPDYSYTGDYLYYTVTGTLQYSLFGGYVGRLFSSQLYLWLMGGDIGWIKAVSSVAQPFETNALAGVGIGIELVMFRHLSIPIEVGYIGQFPNTPLLTFSVASGIRYRY